MRASLLRRAMRRFNAVRAGARGFYLINLLIGINFGAGGFALCGAVSHGKLRQSTALQYVSLTHTSRVTFRVARERSTVAATCRLMAIRKCGLL
jgi:hypothetical protein